MIKFWIATLSIPFENSEVMYLHQVERELQIKKKNKKDLFGSLENCSQILFKVWKAQLHSLAVHMTVFSQRIKIGKLICHHLS